MKLVALLVAVCVVLGFFRCARAANASSDNTALLMQLVARSDDVQLQLDVLNGVQAALEGRRNISAPAGWSDVYKKLGHCTDARLRSLTRSLAGVYGDRDAIADMRKTLVDPKADLAERRDVLQSLLASGEPGLATTLQQLVSEPGLRDLALSGLAGFNDAKTPDVILTAYAEFDVNARRIALNTLAGRVDYAKPLAAAVKSGRVPAKDLTAFTIRQLRDLDDAGINAFVDQTFGVARPASADKIAQIARYKQWLTDQRLAGASASRGRAIFMRTCAQCHTLYGVGGAVGPDLTGSQRANLDYVLQNVVDPSAIIARDYQVTQIRTKDKHVVSGIATETDHAYKIVTETGVQIVPKANVDKVKKSDLSMMPEGLLNGMSDAEIADLIAYLRTTNQVPMPDTSAAPSKPAR